MTPDPEPELTDYERRLVARWLLDDPTAGDAVARLRPGRRRLVLAEVGYPDSWFTATGL